MYGEYMYGGEQVNVHKVIIGSDYKGDRIPRHLECQLCC